MNWQGATPSPVVPGREWLLGPDCSTCHATPLPQVRYFISWRLIWLLRYECSFFLYIPSGQNTKHSKQRTASFLIATTAFVLIRIIKILMSIQTIRQKKIMVLSGNTNHLLVIVTTVYIFRHCYNECGKYD